MAKEQQEIYGQQVEESTDNGLSLRDILEIGLANWKWFALSVIVCLSIAYVYVQTLPYIYTRSTSVIIKDNKSGGFSESAMFKDLGSMDMINVRSSAETEMLIFQSYRLMQDVVSQLDLDVGYVMQGGLRDRSLYKDSPLAVSFITKDNNSQFSFDIVPISDQEVLLSDFSSNEGWSKKVQLGDTVSTPVGVLVVNNTGIPLTKFKKKVITVNKRRLKDATTRYRRAVSVSLESKNGGALNITMNDTDIKRAEDVINTLIAKYNEDAIADKNRLAVNTARFIDDRLEIISQELGDVDSQIETFKKENELTDITSEAGMSLTMKSGYMNEGVSLENQISLVNFIKDYLSDPVKINDLIPANTGIESAEISGAISEYNQLLLKRDRLMSNSSDRNPMVIDLNQTLSTMRNSIIQSIDNLLVTLNIRMKSIQEQEQIARHKIASVPSQEKQVLSIARQQKIKEELYLYLLNKREENALNMAITESNARVIDAANGSDTPVSPKTMMILLAALAIGCVIPAAVIALIMLLNTTVRGRKDIEDNTTVPFLAEIPFKRNKAEGDIVIVREGGRDSVSEAFRILRTNLDFMVGGENNAKVIMLTSANPGSGKTFVSFNLAMTLALAGKKVLLLDVDLRKRSLSKRMHAEGIGLTNYLSGRVNNIDELIMKDEFHECLDVIHAGPTPPNPAELLLSKRLDILVDEIRNRYDYIIIDSVPSMMVADASITARVTDITIYVIREGLMDRRQLADVERIYRGNAFKKLCILLNGVGMKQKRYGYGYGYGYSYGYGEEEQNMEPQLHEKRWWQIF